MMKAADSPADMIVLGTRIGYVINELSVVTATLVDGYFAETLGVTQVFCGRQVARQRRTVVEAATATTAVGQ